ncbi:CocE/NonD family hydrolase [Gordonia desulfuricans]|uniref:CocE/NonD family hydrolase n=1 Tax=Gordonia desulfuricans TaxID=89051 RepID=A0A7K3LSJ3_9ACTN|nr:CocE/NonD family hydrolase [Gordonia desulfuricans]NDK91209.1 CocE/NonD family hydrolase [Gordonia desulfuricans]
MHGGSGRIRRGAVLTTLLAVVVAGFVIPPPPADAAPLGLNPLQWTKSHDSERQKYAGISVTPSVPIKMSDGTVLRADIYRPADGAGRATRDKNPVIVNLTPYNKLIAMIAAAGSNVPGLSQPMFDLLASINLSGTPISGTERLLKVANGGLPSVFSVDPKLVRSGYTQIVVDVRGTGTSQGVWDVFGNREQKDTVEVLDWARTLPYSNGDLGMSGYSYSAINQLQAASKRPKGLKAIFPAAPMTDIVADVVAPGSGYGAGFLALWLFAVNATKVIPDVPSLLRGQFDPIWLRDRLNDPAVFVKEYLEGLTATDVNSLSGRTRELVQLDSTYRKALTTDAARIQIPTFVVGGWQDLFTNMEWRALDQLSGVPAAQKKLVMSTGEHMTNGWDMRGAPGQPPSMAVLQRAWFDRWIKGVPNRIDEYPSATSHQQGGGWVQSQQFPRGDQQHRRLYLTPARSGTSPTSVRDGSLSASGPKTTARWTVSPGVTTLCSGDTNRDQIGFLSSFDFCTGDNRIAERGALTFTSPAVPQATSINGPINVHLRTQVDATDGFYVAVVSDVAPDGTSKVLTTGSMTVSIRNQIDRAASRYAPNGDLVDPIYALDAYRRDLVKPGAVQYLDIGTLGTDALIKRGHRVRVSVYAFNAPRAVSFGPISHDSGLKPEHVLLDPANPSWVQLPSSRPIG